LADQLTKEVVVDAILLVASKDLALLEATLPLDEIEECCSEGFGGTMPDKEMVTFVLGMYAGAVAARLSAGLIQREELR
jgi:hypothetical protein